MKTRAPSLHDAVDYLTRYFGKDSPIDRAYRLRSYVFYEKLVSKEFADNVRLKVENRKVKS